ncbi:MAG: hypothetical protein AB1333_02950 [Patescibacteria group bacterium]
MKNEKVVKAIAHQLFQSEKKESESGSLDIPIKKVSRHMHYKIGMNSSKNIVYFSIFYPFFSRTNKTVIKHFIAKKMEEVKKEPFSSIQMMYLSKDTGNLGITQTISIEKVTKKELTEKISFLLEQVEKFWPFKY